MVLDGVTVKPTDDVDLQKEYQFISISQLIKTIVINNLNYYYYYDKKKNSINACAAHSSSDGCSGTDKQ